MKIFVTGGGGYIGSFMVRALCDRGDEVYVIDNFKNGYKDAIDKRAKVFEGDILDKEFIRGIFEKINDVDAIVHFAGLISVGESMKNPGVYFENNILGVLNLLENIKEKGTQFIFSSTAAVYGNPIKIPIPEDHVKLPTSPYGASKLMAEDIIKWYGEIFQIQYSILRYFNASGAALDNTLGERHSPEMHIIPNAIRAAMNSTEFTLFGVDYDTPDGTCIRDYIHVLDLIEAHILCIDNSKIKSEKIYNVGTGAGFSNREIIKMVEEVSGKKIKIREVGRRVGDPEKLISDPARIKKELGFSPKYSDLKTIVNTAYEWHKKSPVR